MDRRFRQFVFLSLGLLVIVELLNWLYVPTNELAAQLRETDGYAAVIHGGIPLWALLVVVRALILFGLLSFHRIARLLFLLLTIGSVLMTLFWGYRVTSPLEAPFYYLETLVDGVILALAYYSPVSRRFSAKQF